MKNVEFKGLHIFYFKNFTYLIYCVKNSIALIDHVDHLMEHLMNKLKYNKHIINLQSIIQLSILLKKYTIVLCCYDKKAFCL